MTTIENPATEKMNGSSRMTDYPDSPWWIVRPSLAASLAGSFALAYGVYRFAGMVQPPSAVTPRTATALMHLLSATPTLGLIGVIAGVLAFRQRGRRAMQILCALLALASFAGVGLNVARGANGTGPIETLIEKAFTNASLSFVGK